MKKMILNVPLRHKAEQHQPMECVVEKTVEIPHRYFEQMRLHPLQDNPYISERKGFMWNDGDIAHCVLFLDRDGNDGILVQSEGSNYARRSQYIANARKLAIAQEFSDAELNIHAYLMKMAAEAAVRMQKGETAFNFKELAEEVLGLDFQEELCKALVEQLDRREDVRSAEYISMQIDFQPDLDVKPKPLHTMRLISPLKIMTVPEDYDDCEEFIEPRAAVSCRDEINRFMQRYTDENERDRGLMVYYDDNSPINEKIFSAVPSVETINGELMGVLTCRISESLTDAEMAEIHRWWRGQRSDGYGEGLEQHAIRTAEFGEIYVSLWDGTTDCDVEIEETMNAADPEEAPQIGGISL